jgi:hypothetical protein
MLRLEMTSQSPSLLRTLAVCKNVTDTFGIGVRVKVLQGTMMYHMQFVLILKFALSGLLKYRIIVL